MFDKDLYDDDPFLEALDEWIDAGQREEAKKRTTPASGSAGVVRKETEKQANPCYVREFNPCLDCDCYDMDMGCTMSWYTMWCSCPVYGDSEEELAKIFEEKEGK